MLIEVLKHIPIWVFVLFAVLVRLGFVFSRGRKISLVRGVMVPLAMSGLSVMGVLSAFPGMLSGIAAWAAGLLLALAACAALGYPRGVKRVSEEHALLPGSWVPMMLMMGIFFTKFGVNVAMAMQPGLAQTGSFALAVCAIYGAFSGIFLSRAVAVLRAFWAAPASVELAGA